MSNLVDLTKKVKVQLEKKGAKPDVKAQVGFAIDISGSMRGLYNNGTMQDIVNRVQALANRFDDNQTLDMWAFHNDVYELIPAVPAMFGNYVNSYVLSLGSKLWGGTSFHPVVSAIQQHYFGPEIVKVTTSNVKPSTGFFGKLFGKTEIEQKTETVLSPKTNMSTDPVYLIFLTDGDNDDETKTSSIIASLVNENIYIQFVGVGKGSTFRYVKKMASLYDHVGFVDFSDPDEVTDDQMFDELLNPEFIKWINK